MEIEAIADGITTSLTDGNPYFMSGGDGWFLPDPKWYRESGPNQDGETVTAVNILPRYGTFSLYFSADDEAALEARRDEIRRIFVPSFGNPVQIRFTRADTKVREILCYLARMGNIMLSPQDIAGFTHVIKLQLYAPDPFFYDPTQKTSSFAGTALTDWWLAGNTIDPSNVLEHVEDLTSPQQMTWGTIQATVPSGSPWAVIVYHDVIADVAASGGTTGEVYDMDNSVHANNQDNSPMIYSVAPFITMSFGTAFAYPGNSAYLTGVDGAVARGYRRNISSGNYFQAMSDVASTQGITGGTADRYWLADHAGVANVWAGTLVRGAIYNIWPDANQRANLFNSIESGGSIQFGNIAYLGDVNEFPVITIDGPISDPKIVNVSTNEVLDFTGTAIPDGDTWTIDLRYATKTITDNNGARKNAAISTESNLETWHLGGIKEVAGGTNYIQVSGSAQGTAANFTVAYYDRFSGY